MVRLAHQASGSMLHPIENKSMLAKTHAAAVHNVDIQKSILSIRGKRVMIDRDLALLYGVETKRLNEQVKRNIHRFPGEFMFQLTREEKNEVVANCDHLSSLKFSKVNPYAFTEHGTVMLAAVLNSGVAITMSIVIVKAFVNIRKWALTNELLAKRIDDLESKYDSKFKTVFTALRRLIDQPAVERNPIGFIKEKTTKEKPK
jgi:hypothetical protein